MLEINKVHCGDCLELMKQIPDNTITAIVTDPPYGLNFMGSAWDRLGDKSANYTDLNKLHESQDKFPMNKFRGRPIRETGGKQQQEWHYVWAREALRVVKPGGFLLAFGGSKTYHRMVCAIEDAGWEIRDCIMWVYGSGFPKSYNISKSIDKKVGVSGIEESKKWDGYGTALKPAFEPIVVAMRPVEKNFVTNALNHGVAGLNIDECRVTTGGKTLGRFPANFIHDGSEEVGDLFPITKSGAMKRVVEGYESDSVTNFIKGRSGPHNQHGDSGSASRFFYCAKSSKKERGEDNTHPTVKPVSLIEYLVRLVKMPEGTLILDPFLGSGTTGVACKNLNIDFIGLEKEEKYCEIAERRIDNA